MASEEPVPKNDGDPAGPGDARVPVTLPPRVRRAVVEFAAEVLGVMPDGEVPVGLRKIRGFAPAQRARAGNTPLATALERDAGFRRRVSLAWREVHPELAEQLTAGEVAPAIDPVLVAVGLYLCRPDGWEQRLAATGDRPTGRSIPQQINPHTGEAADRDEPGAERADAHRAALARAQAEAAAAQQAQHELAEEVTKLRREQRRLRADADRARSATREVERVAALEHARLTAALAERDEAARQAERQAEEARHQLEVARRSARDGRSLAEVRARLLLDTIVDSAAALRRELALPPAGQTPADLVAEQLTESVPGPVSTRGRSGDDPELLAELLRLPRAHLLVDGYNVTMEAYGALPLVDQRRLLVDALAALAARTSAEITCCFDGAEVEARTQGLVKGVRVLFSDPGTTADDLIGRLVRAEPAGRVLMVVSSDGEVAAAAVAASARSFRSSVLLRLLGAGQRDRRR